MTRAANPGPAPLTPWIELAEKLSEQGALANLQTQLAVVKTKGPPEVPTYLALAARALAGGLVRLRMQRESAR
jgi:hypothetical protein